MNFTRGVGTGFLGCDGLRNQWSGGLKLTMMVTSEYNERVTWCLIMSIESQRAGIKVCLLIPHERNPNIATRYAAWGYLCGTPAYLIIDICDGHRDRRIMVMWRPTQGCCRLGVSSCCEPSPLCRGVWFIADGTVALGNIGNYFYTVWILVILP